MEVTRRIAAGHLDGSDQRAAAGDEKRSAGGIGGDVARCDLAAEKVTATRSMECALFE